MADLRHLDRSVGRRRASELLERFDLVEGSGQMVATYSGGTRRRLDLAMTLTGGPRIIFLDELTTGRDPRGRRTLWQIIRDLVAGGATVFLTAHVRTMRRWYPPTGREHPASASATPAMIVRADANLNLATCATASQTPRTG